MLMDRKLKNSNSISVIKINSDILLNLNLITYGRNKY